MATAYEHVAAALRREMDSGTFPPGSKLPTIPYLEKRFQVSRITVRSALESLAREGRIYTAGRLGTFVRSREVFPFVVTGPTRTNRPHRDADVFTESAEDAARSSSKQFAMRMEPIPAPMAYRLGVTEDELVITRNVVQILDDEPWSWEVSYYPLELGKRAGLDAPHDIPQGTARALADAGFVETGWLDEQHARSATAEEASVLAVPQTTQIADFIRTAATDEQITRITRLRFLAEKTRIVHEIGSDQGLAPIYAVRAGRTEP